MDIIASFERHILLRFTDCYITLYSRVFLACFLSLFTRSLRMPALRPALQAGPMRNPSERTSVVLRDLSLYRGV